jgi:phosphopantetheine adenylyltransferase
MRDMDGLAPEMTVTAAEYEAAGNTARIIKGKIVIGKTAEEKAEEEKQAKILKYKAELAELDREVGSGRPVRDISMSLAEKNGLTGSPAYKNLKDIEKRAEEIREKLDLLLN